MAVPAMGLAFLNFHTDNITESANGVRYRNSAGFNPGGEVRQGRSAIIDFFNSLHRALLLKYLECSVELGVAAEDDEDVPGLYHEVRVRVGQGLALSHRGYDRGP